MKRQITALLAGGVLALALFGEAKAGPLEDFDAAYQHGDFAAAVQLLRPLAAQWLASAGRSVAHNWPTLITWALAFANSNSGNEIVRPETLGPAGREL